MLGYWRFFLAVMVVFGHGYTPVRTYFGGYAVASFYLLSGFLITLVLNEKYRGVRGRIAFIHNRFLRLYPTYWVCLLIVIVGGKIGGWLEPGEIPRSIVIWAREITMVGITLYNGPNLIGQAWTVWIELFFYGLMALGLSSRAWCAYLWLGVSLLVHGWFKYKLHSEYPLYWWDHMWSRLGSSLPFAIGAAGYWFSKRLGHRDLSVICAVLIIGMVVHACLVGPIWGGPYSHGFYFNMLIGGAIVIISRRTNTTRHRWFAHLDKWLGDLTYPFYLIHYSALQAAATILGYTTVLQRSPMVSLLGLAIALPVSVLIWFVVDRPIARMRNRVRVDAAVHSHPV